MRRLAVAVWLLGTVGYALHSMTSSDPAEEEIANQLSVNEVSIEGSKGNASNLIESRATSSTNPGMSTAVGADDPIYEEPVQHVRVSRPVGAHSQPSISSPTTYRYPQGKELQALRRQGPWVEVLDPVTKFKGWVLHLYLSSPDVTVAQNSGAVPDSHGKAAPALIPANGETYHPATETPKTKKVKLNDGRSKTKIAGQRSNRVTREEARGEKAQYAEPRLYKRKPYSRGYGLGRYAARPHYETGYPERRFLIPPLALRRYRSPY